MRSENAAKGDQHSDEIRRLINQAIEDNYQRIWSDRERLVQEETLTRLGFESRLWDRWEAAYTALDLLLIAARSFGKAVHDGTSEEDWRGREELYTAMVRIHARACFVASEVRALLVAGHASGAMTRWRSLHELWVTAAFLAKHGNDTATRYIDHASIQTARAAEFYRANYQELNYDPLDDDAYERAIHARKQLIARYGKQFAEDYGWASTVLSGRATFREIEKDVGLNRWRSHFQMASHSVHAGFKGMMFDIGVSDPVFLESMMLAGPTNSGLTDPAHCTAIALANCTITLLSLRGTLEDTIAIHVLLRLTEDVGDVFLAIQREIDEEESGTS